MGKFIDHEDYIRDFNTRQIIGILRYRPNGDIEAVEFSTRRILGFYRAAHDHTTDFYGRVKTKGNAVAAFIYDAWTAKHPKR